MVYFLISLVFFVSQSFAAVVPSGVPAKCYGGGILCVPNTDTTYFMITAGAGNTASSGLTFAFQKDGVAYQVTAGKTAVCEVISYFGGREFQLMSATATFSNPAGTAVASLVGPVYQIGFSDQAGANTDGFKPQVTDQVYNESIYYKFSSSVFPGIQIQGATGRAVVKLICKEI